MNKYEVILNKWMSAPTAEELDEDSDGDEIIDDRLLDDVKQKKRSKEDTERISRKMLGLSKAQKYEFMQAFSVVAGEGVNSISEEQVYDVLLAMGYSFQEDDMEELLDNSAVDADGQYTADNLVSAFDTWLVEQLRTEELSAVFTYLVKSQEPRKSKPATAAATAGGLGTISEDGDSDSGSEEDKSEAAGSQSTTVQRRSRYGADQTVLSSADAASLKQRTPQSIDSALLQEQELERDKRLKNFLTKFPAQFVSKRSLPQELPPLDPAPAQSRLGRGGALAAVLYAMQRDLGDVVAEDEDGNPAELRHTAAAASVDDTAAAAAVASQQQEQLREQQQLSRRFQLAQDAEDLARELSTDPNEGDFKVSFNDFLRLFRSGTF